jgi:hypothetical protein
MSLARGFGQPGDPLYQEISAVEAFSSTDKHPAPLGRAIVPALNVITKFFAVITNVAFPASPRDSCFDRASFHAMTAQIHLKRGPAHEYPRISGQGALAQLWHPGV